MNSSVKQAQKEGASVAAIAAGLSISIVKNAVYKVLRAPSAADLGEHIVVQGGTFLNDAVLRSFETEMGRDVVRPTIAGLMGAFGAALHARDLHLEKTALLSPEELGAFTHTARPAQCGLCTNHCALTVNVFDGGRRFISGNRCSRPLGKQKASCRTFTDTNTTNCVPCTAQEKATAAAPHRHSDGAQHVREPAVLVRVLHKAQFRGRPLAGIHAQALHQGPAHDPVRHGLLPRQAPARTHREPHRRGRGRGILPCMPYNFDEGKGDNNYNCPVVAYYPELIGAIMPRLKQVRYLNPYFGLHRPKDFAARAGKYFASEFGVPEEETRGAAKAAYAAYDAYKDDLRREGERYIEEARRDGKRILVVAGRPYHIDPEINHGIDELITSFGFVLITEDAVAHHMDRAPRRVLNQWTYQSRMYGAARYVCTQPDMQLVQLVSFGCGIDAITGDEMRDILEGGGKLYTQLKIDDINNLGAVKIRIRSLLAAIEAARPGTGRADPALRDTLPADTYAKGLLLMAKLVYDETGRLLFTREMKKEYTLLMPQMLPVHFTMMQRCFELHGYKVDMLTTNHRGIVDEGLKYVHNDTCYPALLVIGQLIDAVKHGGHDPHKVGLLITQTGGGCRASNYIHLLRKALKKAGLADIPVVSVNLSGLEKNPGFSLTLPLIRELVFSMMYGDILVQTANQCRPTRRSRARRTRSSRNGSNGSSRAFRAAGA
jgi:predicted nucleotide-binding protein (sugar kinase/HSP70/actin superfamily)